MLKKFILAILIFFLPITAHAAMTTSGGGSGTDLTGSNSHTVGDGASGDVCWTYNGDSGSDGTQCYDVSEDAHVFSQIIKLLSDSNCSPDTAGDMCFDTDIYGVGRGAPCWYDGNAIVCSVGVPTSDPFNAGSVIKATAGGTYTHQTDDTGTGLGTNLSSSTTDILSDTGAMVLGGTGNTNNEKLSWDYETTANEVAVTTSTGVTILDFSAFTIQGASFEAAAR